MTIARFALLFIACLTIAFDAKAQDTTITYQGQLKQTGQPFTGLANLEFRLFEQLSGGNQIGTTQSRPNWPVEDGLFQAELDFGLAAFNQQVRYLEVRVNGTALVPRQAIRPSPMALFALSGNEGPEGPPGASPFTLDPVTGTIEYQFNNQLFRLVPDGSSTMPPRITLGHNSNENPLRGGVISGGGTSANPNRITAGNFGVIGGGFGNTVTQASGTVSGGRDNTAGQEAFIGGGNANTVAAYGVVGGGISNTASGIWSMVGGGQTNTASGQHASVGAGSNNAARGSFSRVGGGASNIARGDRSVVAGGVLNSTWGGWSTISGGYSNCAGGSYSWAGGRQAKARPGSAFGTPESGCENVPLNGTTGDSGTFVWADSQSSDFVSSGTNQFLVRTNGGAVFTNGSVNDPAGNRLRVDGLLRVDTLGSAGATSLCRNANNQIASCSSSARYKQDIVNLESGAALIEQLRPVQYRWIDSGEADLGFVAEEVAELIPEVITYNQSGEVEGIEYNRLTVVLVRAMQEQQDENRLLRAELAQLKEQTAHIELLATRNADLQNRLAALEALLLEGRKLAGGQ